MDEFALRASVAELVHDFRTNAYRRVVLYPDAITVLRRLRADGHPLGVVSNGSTATQTRKLATTAL